MRRADILSKFEDHAILPTPQRLEVAHILLEKAQHMSVEQIIERLQAAGSTVSKATVYNTLNLFGERGLVRELAVESGCRLFDSATHAHHHYYNVDTGELSDIHDKQLSLQTLPGLPEGTELDGVEILIRVRKRQD